MNYTLHNGDCLEVLRTMPDNSVDSVVTDPPYGLAFMGKKWDYDVPSIEIWQECLRVLKPGGHLLAFAGTRTQHRMAVRIEDAGFEIRDMIAWVYGSGFPKSHDISKAIDRQRDDREQVYQVTAWIRSARDAAGKSNRDIDDAFGFAGMAGHWTSTKSQPAVPTLEQIPKLLDVLGLRLDNVPDDIRELIWTLNGNKGQPGAAWFEREVLGQKEMIDTTKARAGFSGAAHSPDYDGSKRVVNITAPATPAAKQWEGWGTALKPALEPITVARNPLRGTVAANVLEWGTGGINVDRSRIPCESGQGRFPANLIHDGSDEVVGFMGESFRFFYCAKASKADRGDGNNHPTVKPTDLMRYLCRLVTPPGGIVLDPFTGSGSTGKAAILEGFQFIGIEREAEYVEIARARMEHALNNKPNTLF